MLFILRLYFVPNSIRNPILDLLKYHTSEEYGINLQSRWVTVEKDSTSLLFNCSYPIKVQKGWGIMNNEKIEHKSIVQVVILVLNSMSNRHKMQVYCRVTFYSHFQFVQFYFLRQVCRCSFYTFLHAYADGLLWFPYRNIFAFHVRLKPELTGQSRILCCILLYAYIVIVVQKTSFDSKPQYKM